MKTFSEKVREKRTEMGLSQKELGDRVGVSTRTIVSYENANVLPRTATLMRLAQVLQVSETYLKRDDVIDPESGFGKEGLLSEIRKKYGSRVAREIDFLVERSAALFAGGELSQEAKDAYFEAILQAYMQCKEEARKRYGHEGKE